MFTNCSSGSTNLARKPRTIPQPPKSADIHGNPRMQKKPRGGPPGSFLHLPGLEMDWDDGLGLGVSGSRVKVQGFGVEG